MEYRCLPDEGPQGLMLVPKHLVKYMRVSIGYLCSDLIWDFKKLPFPSHLGKYFIKIGKISAKIHEYGKIKTIFELEMTPIKGC